MVSLSLLKRLCGAGNVLYLDPGGDSIKRYISENPLSCPLKMVHLTAVMDIDMVSLLHYLCFSLSSVFPIGYKYHESRYVSSCSWSYRCVCIQTEQHLEDTGCSMKSY